MHRFHASHLLNMLFPMIHSIKSRILNIILPVCQAFQVPLGCLVFLGDLVFLGLQVYQKVQELLYHLLDLLHRQHLFHQVVQEDPWDLEIQVLLIWPHHLTLLLEQQIWYHQVDQVVQEVQEAQVFLPFQAIPCFQDYQVCQLDPTEETMFVFDFTKL